MRWNKTEIGSTRIIKKLLIFPKTIGGETRWLEFVKYKQEYRYDTEASSGDRCFWFDMRWLGE